MRAKWAGNSHRHCTWTLFICLFVCCFRLPIEICLFIYFCRWICLPYFCLYEIRFWILPKELRSQPNHAIDAIENECNVVSHAFRQRQLIHRCRCWLFLSDKPWAKERVIRGDSVCFLYFVRAFHQMEELEWFELIWHRKSCQMSTPIR